MKNSCNAPNVVHLIPSLEVGGMERLVVDLATGRKSGQTSIMCLNKLGALGEQIEKEVTIKVLNIPKNLFCATIAVYKLLRKIKPDVIHCHNMQAHFFGSICALFIPNTKVVLTKHGQHIPSVGFAAKINKLTLRRSKIVGVSSDITQIMQKWITKNKHTIEYIANGVSLTPYKNLKPQSVAKKELSIEHGTFCVGIVARLSHPKDHVLLIDAVAAISKTHANIKLIIIGDGPLRQHIESHINKNQYQKVVTMLGERKDIANILGALDVFALASSSEGIPMTILEAMAASLPVIATNVGGVPQVVINNETGILVENKNKEDLIKAIQFFVEAPENIAIYGKKGRLLLENNYSINQAIGKYECIYLN